MHFLKGYQKKNYGNLKICSMYEFFPCGLIFFLYIFQGSMGLWVKWQCYNLLFWLIYIEIINFQAHVIGFCVIKRLHTIFYFGWYAKELVFLRICSEQGLLFYFACLVLVRIELRIATHVRRTSFPNFFLSRWPRPFI